MASNSVIAELTAVVDVETKSGDTPQAFANRLARAANNVKDDEWQGLSEPTQAWVNAALGAIENKTELPLPSGIEDLDLSGKEPEQADLEEAIEKAPKKPKKEKAPKEVKAAKPAKAPKTPKKVAVVNGAKTATPKGPRGLFVATDKIKIVAKENPFRKGSKSADWFAKYKAGMTVQDAIEAGVPRHHIRWDRTLGNITVG